MNQKTSRRQTMVFPNWVPRHPRVPEQTQMAEVGYFQHSVET